MKSFIKYQTIETQKFDKKLNAIIITFTDYCTEFNVDKGILEKTFISKKSQIEHFIVKKGIK